MLEIKNLSIKKKQEDRELIDNLSFVLNAGDKFAVIGLEGNGKSTLLKAIMGHELPYVEITGTIQTHKNRLGYLPQALDPFWRDVNVTDYLIKNHPDDVPDAEMYALLALVDRTLEYVNFNHELFDETKKINEYSGGEIVKLGLVKLLLRNPEVLLLDEPTNDLDLNTILFLEDFISSETRPILFISHDETLLENTANGIIHLVQIHKKQKAETYFEKCGYQEYKEKRNLSLMSREMIARKQRSNLKKKLEKFRQVYQKVEHQQNQAVRNPTLGRLLAKKMKSLKSTEKRFKKEKENFLDIPEYEESIDLFFDDSIEMPNNRVVVDYHKDVLEIAEMVLSRNINLLLKGPVKICIIGDNGSGKTTLLKDIMSQIKDKPNLNVGYMAQDYDDQIDLEKSALSVIIDPRDKEKQARVRKMMGALQFTREEMLYKWKKLSGGQKAKLLLLKMVYEGHNVLILDEPTRNLSPLSIPIVHQLLLSFKGAIICVSHDRSFIENVFDDIYLLNEEGLEKL